MVVGGGSDDSPDTETSCDVSNVMVFSTEEH